MYLAFSLWLSVANHESGIEGSNGFSLSTISPPLARFEPTMETEEQLNLMFMYRHYKGAHFHCPALRALFTRSFMLIDGYFEGRVCASQGQGVCKVRMLIAFLRSAFS